MRAFFNALSRSERLQRMTVGFGPARRIARRFTAGESLDDAVAAAAGLNSRGMEVTLNHLGEHVASEADARRAAAEYAELAQRIGREGLRASISVKPSQIGLGLGQGFFRSRMEEVLEAAGPLHVLVEVDMEESAFTDATLSAFHGLLGRSCGMRIALQAYLFRTEQDLAGLIRRGSSARLVKGAYDEPPSLAWQKRSEVDRSFERLVQASFGPEPAASGFYPAFGTHDHRLIARACDLAAERGIDKSRFEFQMLLGVRRDWQERLAAEGFRVRVYVPYGSHWYPYFMRRMGERPANMLFVARAMFGK